MRHSFLALLLSTIALDGCAPVPLPGKIYVAVNENGTPPKRKPATVCAVNEIDKAARRTAGRLEIAVFEPGAVRLGGRPVALAPITFKRINDPATSFFPCIPS